MSSERGRADPPPKAGSTNKLLGLELIRFVSALAVLVWHYQHFSYIADRPVNFVRESQPFYAVLKIFYDDGYYGVEIFWCISGFIFFWKYRDAITRGLVGAKTFFILRFSRLYPLHVATLLTVALLQAFFFERHGYYFVFENNDTFHFVLQLFFASSWGFQSGDSFNGPVWSISVEVLVYGLFFIVLRYVGSSALVNVAIIVLCFAAKALGVTSPIVKCAAFFYAGGLSAYAFAFLRTTSLHKAFAAICLLVVVACPLLFSVSSLSMRKYSDDIFLLIVVPALLYLGAHDFPVTPTLQTWIEAAGNATYSSYLVHFPLQLTIAIFYMLIGKEIPFYSPFLFVFFIGTTMVAAVLIYRYFEKPAQTAIRQQVKAATVVVPKREQFHSAASMDW